MTDSTVTEKEYSRWLTPQAALQRIAGANKDWERAAQDILRRAHAGKIGVCAEDVHITKGVKSWKMDAYTYLPDAVLRSWTNSQRQATLGFWSSAGGDGEATVINQDGDKKKYALFGIRFEPEAINKLAATAETAVDRTYPDKPPRPPVLPAAAPATTPKEAPELQTARPVAPALLAKWAALYVETYPEAEDSLDKAWASAKGMFQGKRVARDKAVAAVKKIRPRKSGRKPTLGE